MDQGGRLYNLHASMHAFGEVLLLDLTVAFMPGQHLCSAQSCLLLYVQICLLGLYCTA